jgi:hypothetical protein
MALRGTIYGYECRIGYLFPIRQPWPRHGTIYGYECRIGHLFLIRQPWPRTAPFIAMNAWYTCMA